MNLLVYIPPAKSGSNALIRMAHLWVVIDSVKFSILYKYIDSVKFVKVGKTGKMYPRHSRHEFVMNDALHFMLD
jgi:hypothetical protein